MGVTAGALLLSAALRLEPCTIPGVPEPLRCGVLEVPEKRATPRGRRIGLRIVVVPAKEAAAGAAPLFHLEGGPGVAATVMAPLYAVELPEYRRRRDVVLVDRRGTGGSNGLGCPGDEMRSRLEQMYPAPSVADCRRSLEGRADLTQYTTDAAADDLDEVRAALGYARIDIFGLSYGTRLALVYMRRHPARVRSVVLMGPAPTDLAMPLHHAPDGQRALELMFSDCAAEAGCGRAFPRLKQELAEVLDRLDKSPAAVTLDDPRSGRPVTYHLTRGAFAEQVRSRLYAPASRAGVPLAIHAARRGDFGPFLKPLRSGGEGPAIAEGLYLSVTCAEDVPFIDPAEAGRLAAGTALGLYRVREQRAACAQWPRATVSADFRRPVESKAPTLIVSGERDPVTPPRLGEEVLRHLANGRHVVIPQGAHVPIGIEPVACLDGIILHFFEEPWAKDLDTRCVKDMRAPPFVLPSP
jgi:pimeloyl-ACP methyl ester carboxylesterase